MIQRAALHPVHVARLAALKREIYSIRGDLSAQFAPSAEPVKYRDIDKLTFFPIRKGDVWAECDNSIRYDCAWFRFTGKVPKKITESDEVVALIDIGGEGLAYRDGKAVRGITQVLSGVDMFQSRKGKQVVELSPVKTGDDILLEVDAGFNGKRNKPNARAVFRHAYIAVKNNAAYTMYYDYLHTLAVILTYPDNENIDKARCAELERALKAAYSKYRRGDSAGAHALLSEIKDIPCNGDTVRYTAIGHAHLDLGWLWPVRETKRKGARTLATALANIEAYDDYVFGVSQAQLLQWIKEDYPKIFQDVQEAVAADRIEPQGGMWVECDCNIPSGESIIRQFLYGGKFFRQELGRDSDVVWLPDVFGYAANLPQIMRGCGKKYFMTIKLTWNTVNKFPYKTFRWRGIDGSEVLAHMAPQGDYNSSASPFAIVKSDKGNPHRQDIKEALLIYGVGDGGGGPGEAQIEFVRRSKDVAGLGKVETGSAQSFFDNLQEYADKAPVYEGELYLEKHRGTYTSQAKVKMNNRVCERLLHEIEWLGANALAHGKEYYPAETEKMWKEVLLYQFHDILPGSSVKRVYDECNRGYAKIIERAEDIKRKLIASLADEGEPAQCGDLPVCINASPFDRFENVCADGMWYKVKVPAYSATKVDEYSPVGRVGCDSDRLFNGRLNVVFGAGGEIVSLTGADGREYSKDYLNKLVVFTDPKMYYNAWDIRPDYAKLKSYAPKLVYCKTSADGVRATRENVYRFNRSQIKQKIYIEDGGDVVYIDTYVKWRESNKMLRAQFAPSVYGDTVNCDVQMGNCDRSTREESDTEKAQFEICAHKFVNVDGDGAGIAVLNNGKYGYRVKSGLISLNLLRSPKYPDATCDMGEHRFTYAIYPHTGKWSGSNVVEEGYRLNNPMIVTDSMPNLYTFVSYDCAGVITETVKPAEDGSGIVVRLYERKGASCEITPSYAECVDEALECDMVENIIGKAQPKLQFTPYMIKTLYLRLKK